MVPTFLSVYRLGLLVALVSALTATTWGVVTALLVLATLAGFHWSARTH
jgi:hypothetical protein